MEFNLFDFLPIFFAVFAAFSALLIAKIVSKAVLAFFQNLQNHIPSHFNASSTVEYSSNSSSTYHFNFQNEKLKLPCIHCCPQCATMDNNRL